MAWLKRICAFIVITLFCGIFWLYDYIGSEFYRISIQQTVDMTELYEAEAEFYSVIIQQYEALAATLASARAAETEAFQTYMENTE